MSVITEHKNAHLSTENMHEVKGFPSAPAGTSTRKSINGQSEFLRDSKLPNAIDIINGYEAPTTENEGDIYVIESPEIDIDGIVWQSGNIVRFTFSAGYDNALYSANSFLQVSGETTKAVHNGVWKITAVNVSYLEVTNIDVIDGTDDVVSSSPASAYVSHQDYDPEKLSNDQSIPIVGQVRYYVNSDLWFGNAFKEGDCYYNESNKIIECFDGESISPSLKIVTSSVTLDNSDGWVEITPAAAFTVKLPASPTKGFIKKFTDVTGITSTYAVTVDGNGKNIEGESTYIINSNYEHPFFRYNGTQWNKI